MAKGLLAIQPHEQNMGEKNPYVQLKVRSAISRSHEYSSQGWDTFRSLEKQSPNGTIARMWLMSPAGCLTLMAGNLPGSSGRYPFAFGNVWATPRNLWLLGQAIKNQELVIMEEDEAKFKSLCKEMSDDIAKVESEILGIPLKKTETAGK